MDLNSDMPQNSRHAPHEGGRVKRILRICVAVVGLVIAALAAVYGVGLALPEQHVSEGAELVPAPVDAVAQRIRDVAKQPDWRHGVDAVVEDGRDGDRVRYHESSGGDAIAFVLREQVPGRQFVTVITDADLPFGGRWQIRLEPVDGNTTRVHIREEGFVRAPFFRTISRFVIGHDTTLKAYLSDLRASFARASSGSRRDGVRGSHQAAVLLPLGMNSTAISLTSQQLKRLALRKPGHGPAIRHAAPRDALIEQQDPNGQRLVALGDALVLRRPGIDLTY